ncbi:hypothetical protein EYF80_008191 [Liparis tanakae]|uniref:Uncharacterized protein n=1 Tax=Liparis tanakae TaxID=230148 RepID=A0A4Z2IUX5_9TELE|nr:hypothetical protein EYF80_008191 [Liparis tanakae]
MVTAISRNPPAAIVLGNNGTAYESYSQLTVRRRSAVMLLKGLLTRHWRAPWLELSTGRRATVSLSTEKVTLSL